MNTELATMTPRPKRKPRKTAYTFDELPNDVQLSVLDKYRGWNIDDQNFWAESIERDFIEKLSNQGFTVEKKKWHSDAKEEKPCIYWDVSCCQGSGASFEAEVDLEKYIKANLQDLIKARYNIFTLREIINNDPSISDWEVEPVHIEQGSNHYVHEMTMRIILDWRGDGFPEGVEKTLDRLRDGILEDARSLAKEFHRQLNNERDYQSSDECLRESFKANDTKFNLEGKMV